MWWLKPVMVAAWEVEIRRIMVQSQSWAKSSQDHPPISTSDWAWLYMPVILAMQEAHRRNTVQSGLGKTPDSISKITNAERAGRVAQVVKCLPNKREAQHSTPSTSKKKK
jgi:hypothetical protein